MIRIERLLFYPAVLAASIFAVREAFLNPSPAAFAAVGALGVIWVFTAFRAFFWFARVAFWMTLVTVGGAWAWFRFGAG